MASLRQLLGGQTPARFLERHWHKEPLLIRDAIPSFAGIVDREALFALATRDDVASRLVQRTRHQYSLQHGPFTSARLRRLPDRNWTLLVQGVNLHDDAADALLRRFAFVPYARLDDLMVSYAAPGGGVGPHFDSYDVFLLQGSGARRWRYGRQDDLSLRPGLPVKILRHFQPQHDAVLNNGDMLYLPPDCVHDGIAVDECITYSIGFRAPAFQELAEAFLDHLRDAIDIPGRYADPDLRPSRAAGRIDARLQRRVRERLRNIRWDATTVSQFIGRFLTEPKPDVVFERPSRRSRGAFERGIARDGVRLDRKTQLLYDNARYYMNGESASLPADDVPALRKLADRRVLGPDDCAALSEATRALLYEWRTHGFITDAA